MAQEWSPEARAVVEVVMDDILADADYYTLDADGQYEVMCLLSKVADEEAHHLLGG